MFDKWLLYQSACFDIIFEIRQTVYFFVYLESFFLKNVHTDILKKLWSWTIKSDVEKCFYYVLSPQGFLQWRFPWFHSLDARLAIKFIDISIPYIVLKFIFKNITFSLISNWFLTFCIDTLSLGKYLFVSDLQSTLFTITGNTLSLKCSKIKHKYYSIALIISTSLALLMNNKLIIICDFKLHFS